MNDVLLRTSLLDLLHEMGPDADGILLGHGYGLYLKQLHMAEADQPTLIPVDDWPAPRATQDLDLLLSTEVVADARSMRIVRAALDRLDYKVVPGSEHLQFLRKVGGTQRIKIDLLTAQLDVLRGIPTIQADSRRARPNVASPRQRLVINRMLSGFHGFLSTSKYAKLAKCSTDTALRDIRELLRRGILIQNTASGRSTSYRLGDLKSVRD